MADRRALDPVRVDCFLLADGAQSVDGKLYVLGGGWNVLTTEGPDSVVPMVSLAVHFVVPWHETNRPLAFELQLEDPDGNHLLGTPLMFEIDVGRPATLPAGTEQAAPMALNLTNVAFQRAGSYAFTLSLEGQELARTRFLVNFVSPLPPPRGFPTP